MTRWQRFLNAGFTVPRWFPEWLVYPLAFLAGGALALLAIWLFR